MAYEKHFISDCRLPEEGQTTFLTDKKVDAQLYAILMEYSVGEKAEDSGTGQAETVVFKDVLPTQLNMATRLNVSRNTYKAHLKYLIENNYIIDVGVKYIINTRKENVYLKIDTDTIAYLNDTCTDPVWKVYLYLGQRWNWKKNNYTFTLEELGEHTGKKINNNKKNYNFIKNILDCLVNNNLIEIASFYDGQTRKIRLVKFNYHHKKNLQE